MATAMIDAGLDVQQAVEMPRWTIRPGTDPVTIGNPFELWLEREFGEERNEQLAARGHTINTKTGWHGSGIIARDPETGVIVGGSDLRVEGQAIAL